MFEEIILAICRVMNAIVVLATTCALLIIPCAILNKMFGLNLLWLNPIDKEVWIIEHINPEPEDDEDDDSDDNR